MNKDITMTLRSLRRRNLRGIYAEDREEAKTKIMGLIPREAVVGMGDSTTMRQIGVIEALKRRGTKVLDGWEQGISRVTHEELIKESTLCDVFLTGTNAVTLDGKLVNVDAGGNRVAGMFYGHPMSIMVVGRNKLVENLDKAFHRIRNLIAPNHIRIRSVELGGLQVDAPCVATGICHDCRSKGRLCNVFTIIEGKPSTDMYVVITNEDLGLAWDESWPKKRISGIVEEYKRFVWVPPRNWFT